MGTISKNFSYREFEVRDSVKALVLEVLQPLRDALGEPMEVNSGYRCPELNRLVGGTSTSQHLKGEAADIASDNPRALAQLAYDLGLPYDQMIVYPTFVHFSHKLAGEQRRMVLYNKSWKGEKIVL